MINLTTQEEEILKNVLEYFFIDIDFKYDDLTEKEKIIFNNKETFDSILKKIIK